MNLEAITVFLVRDNKAMGLTIFIGCWEEFVF